MTVLPKFTKRAAQHIETVMKRHAGDFESGKYLPAVGYTWGSDDHVPEVTLGRHEVGAIPDDYIVECHGIKLVIDFPEQAYSTFEDCILDFDGRRLVFVLSDPAAKTAVTVDAFDHIVLNVRDVEASAAWYERVLGMKRVVTEPRPGRPVTSMHFGRQKINLRPAGTIQEVWFTGRKVAPGSDDLCFLTKMSPREIVRHLWACKVHIEEGPGEKSGAQGTLISVYCRDPDGNLIEISSYK
jgi:catechol 2,3-dioxygenase-like lactoylglutathione lyase family enzyme